MSADPAALLAGLRRLDGFDDIAADALEPMRVKGLVHEHIRIRGRGLVLRVPRYSQFGFAPGDNLAYQTACFQRAAPSRATPGLRGVIPPGDGIAWGALVVDEIVGRSPVLPGDLDSMAECLAAIHVLPLPPPAARPPLMVHSDPLAGIVGFILAQAAYLPEAGLARDAEGQLADEIEWARRLAAAMEGREQPVTLVATDTHPGNFLVEPDGRAVFVDLEKALYGSPAVDLAHASVYTSTMWDPDCAAALVTADVAAFYDHYLSCVPVTLADQLRPWLTPMRRLTWLRTTTWCAKWRVEAAKAPTDGGAGDAVATSSWSAQRHDPALIAAVRARIDDYFDPATIARIRAEWLGPGAGRL